MAAAAVADAPLFATTLVLLATPFVVGTLGDLVVSVFDATDSGFRVGVVLDTVDVALNLAAGLYKKKCFQIFYNLLYFVYLYIIYRYSIFHTLAAVNVEVFVGDTFVRVVFVTLGLSAVSDVFGFVNAVERAVDVTGADLTRVVDDSVVVFVAVVTFEVALVAGLETVLKICNT